MTAPTLDDEQGDAILRKEFPRWLSTDYDVPHDIVVRLIRAGYAAGVAAAAGTVCGVCGQPWTGPCAQSNNRPDACIPVAAAARVPREPTRAPDDHEHPPDEHPPELTDDECRQITHWVWHLFDDGEEIADGIYKLDTNCDDGKRLFALLPMSHPRRAMYDAARAATKE